MKIDFGGGSRPKPGYACCDVRALDTVEFVCDAWDIADYLDEGSVDEVYSRHFFEHLTFAQGVLTLRAWRKILKDGGKGQIIVPNMEWHCRQFLGNREEYSSTREMAETGIYGWQRNTESGDSFVATDDLWDVHKSGYDFRSLSRVLKYCGFRDIVQSAGTVEDRSDDPKHLHVVFYK